MPLLLVHRFEVLARRQRQSRRLRNSGVHLDIQAAINASDTWDALSSTQRIGFAAAAGAANAPSNRVAITKSDANALKATSH